jgi:predicted thioesterase
LRAASRLPPQASGKIRPKPGSVENEMKASLRPGVSRTKRIVIDRDRTISFMGEEARVYATPRLVSDIEYTCRDLIMEHADPGEDSVGTEVAIQHLAATLPGSTVEITVSVAAVDGRRVTFEASARDELDEIGKGRHERFIVDVEKTKVRLKAKAAKRDALVAAKA